MSVMRRRLLCAVMAVLVTLPGSAFASHMRPGLWTVTTTMAMPTMPKISAAAKARMKAMHMAVPTDGQVFTTQECVTPVQAAMDKPPRVGHSDSGCASPNMKYSGSMMTADVICTGEVTGKGSMNASYANPEHYTGKYVFNGTSHGRPINMMITFRGDFAGADCGKVKSVAY